MKRKFYAFVMLLYFSFPLIATAQSLNKTPEWTTSADGILPGLLTNLQLQVNSIYGYHTVSLGDINNDGYNDIAVTAPGMADVIAGSGSLLDVGAVFIYLGSPTGFSQTPSKILQPTTAAAGALFGMSIATGDVTGDHIPDIIIGAPMDTYQTTAKGLLGDVAVNVKAGKVYVYRSEDLFSAPNPSPFLQIRLQGHNYFSTGVLGLLNNVTLNDLFGYSVAVTDDLNGDGKDDIVVGSPAFVGISGLSIQSGAAFVYYSDNLSTITPLSLNLPTPSILGLVSLPLANLNGLLFGFSVDGVGDYNNDGKPDIIIGAPAGINLSSLGGIFSGKALSGSAYVYLGNGSGVNSTIGATLQDSASGLLSNAANLFGFKVKGVLDNTGKRNGNALVSAPMGRVFSNIISGLKLKAGQVLLYKKKTGAISSPVIPDQTLSSPRSSSLLSLLGGHALDVSALYGEDLDNEGDMNCDNYSDIIIGEPLSTTVPLIGANVTGGAAYIYKAKADGTYEPAPMWSVYPTVSSLLGINAVSLVGFSVGGVQGPDHKWHALVGAPADALDFSTGLLNLGNTMSTLFNFTFDNNGIGKAFEFNANLCSLIALPTNLVSFDARKNDSIVMVSWRSADEVNLSHYELQHSTNRVDFKTMALVFAANESSNNYNFPDKKPATGINYYRLRMVDNDGTFTYSTIAVVQFDKMGISTMLLSPNPVVSTFDVTMNNCKSGTYMMKLIDNMGHSILSKSIMVTGEHQTIHVTSLDKAVAGIYHLVLYDNTGKQVQTINISHAGL